MGDRVLGSKVWWARDKQEKQPCARCGYLRYPRTSRKNKNITDLCRDCYQSLTPEERKEWTVHG